MTLAILDWSTAVPDWEDRIRQRRSLVPDLPLFEEYAERAVRIFKRLRAPDVVGQPTLGEICDDWVIEYVRAIFGTYDEETMRRAIPEGFLMVPKKNYKSGIASGIMLTALILNERPFAEMVLVSETQKISGIAFRNISGMINLDDTLKGLFHVVEHQKKVKHLTTEAELQIVSADGDVVTGSKASWVLVDEAHVLAAKTKAPAIYLELRGGLASRPEGFFLQITTQSKKPPEGQFKKELNRARAVRDGKSSSRVLAVLYEFPPDILEGEGWKNPDLWGLVNPNLGLSVDPAFLLEQYNNAKEDGDAELKLFASQHLNVEVGGYGFGDGWSAQRHWDGAADATLSLDELLRRSEVVTIGVDGGGEDDLCGLSVVGREPGSRRWLHWGHVWVQRSVLSLRKSIASKLQDFAEAGELTICDEALQHVEELVELISRVADSGLLPEASGIGLDQAGLPELFDELVEAGLVDPLVVSVPQGWRLAPAVKSIPLRLKSGRMKHAGQSIMAWSVGNAKVETRSNNPMITKELAGVAKIDPVIGLLNAAMLMFYNPVAADAVDYDAVLDNQGHAA